MRRWAAGVCLLLGLLACEDSGRTSLQKAKARYDALIFQGAAVTDPGFDEVREELSRIPPSSSSHPEAQKLLRALEGSRAQLPPRPLAREVSDGSVPETPHEH